MMFIIQGMPRCGTHMLACLLRQQSGVVGIEDEPFNPEMVRRRPTVDDVFAEVSRHERDGWRAGLTAHAYIGSNHPFWLGHHYIDYCRCWDLWERVSDAGIPVVTILRTDRVARMISAVRAKLTGAWHEPSDVRLDVALDPAWAAAYAEATEHAYEEAKARSTVWVTYEALCDDTDATMRTICGVLGIRYAPCKPTTPRTAKPPEWTVTNFAQVRDAYAAALVDAA